MNHRRVAIIVSSDSGYRGEREDLSGPEIRRIAEENGYEIISQIILPDERKNLEKEMIRIADENLADLILTTGGTGFSPRDCMPEATLNVSEKRVPGIPEAMRAYSMQFTKRAMLSRSEAGIRKQTLIVNLPGSPKAVRECLEYVISELGHGLDILIGEATNCAVK
ncbi:MAG: molybdenum cofactor biosynthesis protein B [Oliverpabstia sp.]